MIDISWGETVILIGLGAGLIGRKDLPVASRFIGSQLGRVVGLLQGARARADQYATHNELRLLQNELRSGLRELDQVKTEFAVAASSQGMVGRNLGANVASVNRIGNANARTTVGDNSSSSSSSTGTSNNLRSAAMASSSSSANTRMKSYASPMKGSTFDRNSRQANPPSGPTFDVVMVDDDVSSLPNEVGMTAAILAPKVVSERATMEEEWEKQGIGFVSKAERGDWMGRPVDVQGTSGKSGSELLENIIKQNLIFDQYDRVVGEQEEAMRQRVQDIKDRRDGNDEDKTK